MFGDDRAATGDQRFIGVEELLYRQLPRVEQETVVLGVPAVGFAVVPR